jgi:hypothetical protein
MSSRFTSGISNSTIEIIDCLSPHEMQTGLSLYNYLRDISPRNSAPRIKRHVASSEEEFWSCLDRIETECEAGWKPIIHIEGHASKAGLEVGGGSSSPAPLLTWRALVDRLRAINVASKFNLGVFVAACEGVEALRPMTIKKAAPFMFLVGPNVPVTAETVKDTTRAFYNVIVNTPNLDRAFDGLPKQFTPFLAERFFARIYVRVIKMQNLGRRRNERVNDLVSMVLPGNALPEQLRKVRAMAKAASRPDATQFEAVQRVYLPAGLSFTFDDLVDFARSAKLPD